MNAPLRLFLTLLCGGTVLGAWSPHFHEVQTRLAKRMVPRAMSRFLKMHEAYLLEGARGVASDQVPTVEDVEEQFQRIVSLSEAHRPAHLLVRELGILAKQVQLLSDPSATLGVTPLRNTFEAFSDEHLGELILSREPVWALRAPPDPRPRLLNLIELKYARHRTLTETINAETGGRMGEWDRLSLPYGHLQLAYSTGINATANLYILLWRAVGDLWPIQESPSRFSNH